MFAPRPTASDTTPCTKPLIAAMTPSWVTIATIRFRPAAIAAMTQDCMSTLKPAQKAPMPWTMMVASATQAAGSLPRILMVVIRFCWEGSDVGDLEGVPGLLAGRPLQRRARPALVVLGAVLALPRLVRGDVAGADDVLVRRALVVVAADGDEAVVHRGDDRRAAADGEPGRARERLMPHGLRLRSRLGRRRLHRRDVRPRLQRSRVGERPHVAVGAGGLAVLVERPRMLHPRVTGGGFGVGVPPVVAAIRRPVAVQPAVPGDGTTR